jgi:uncharacterized membrane protein
MVSKLMKEYISDLEERKDKVSKLAEEYLENKRKAQSRRFYNTFALYIGNPIISILSGIGFYVFTYLVTYEPKVSFFMALYICAIVNTGLTFPEIAKE